MAQWLRESADVCGFVPDEVALAVKLPLTPEEWVELVDLAKSLSPDDVHASTLSLPPEGLLRSGAELHSLCEELRKLRILLADVEDGLVDWQQVDSVEPSRMRLLQGRLSDALEWRQQIQHTWLEVVRRVSADAVTGREWSTFVAEVEREREAAIAARRQTASYSVKVPATWDLVFMQGLHSARERFAQRKGVSALLQRSAWKALEQCRVDGRVPSNTRELSVCFAALDRVEAQRRLRNRWANDMRRVGAPALDGDRAPEDAVAEYLGHLRMAVTWDREQWPQLTAELGQAGLRPPSTSTIGALEKVVRVIGQLLDRPRERELTKELEDLEAALRSGATPGASPLWTKLLESFRNEHWNRWDQAVLERRRLGGLAASAKRYLELSATLRRVAPEFARGFLLTRGHEAPQHSQLLRAWEWRQLESWLIKRNAGESPAVLQGRLRSLADRRYRVMEELVATRALLGLQRGFTERKRQALNRYLIAARRFGKTGGKFAARWLREIRDALDESKDAVPVWIMPIGRVLSSFRPDKTPPFDVVIIDEASQSGLLRLPVLALGSKAIVVGDDKQTSPENVGQGQEVVFGLIDQHLGGLRHARTLFDSNNSLYDVAKQRFPDVVSLVEHFRCLPSIIGFSQRYYGNLIPLRDRAPSPHWVAAKTIFVPDGFRDEMDVNEPEARAIVELIAAAHRDPAYDGMSFGVISLLGHWQAPRIRELLLETLGPEGVEARRLRCGEPSDFQGDERDVVFLSLVIDPSRRGTMSGLNPARRMNVAASRARNQLVIVHSVRIEDLASQDERRALLEYFSNPQASDTLYVNLEQRCESEFERDVLRTILNRGYRRVIPQYDPHSAHLPQHFS